MSHLTQAQRYTISQLRQQGFTQTRIAELIENDKSVVSRELRRNSDTNGNYDSQQAQQRYQQRMRAKPKQVRFDAEMRQIVDICLDQDLSPAQIAGRCRLKCV